MIKLLVTVQILKVEFGAGLSRLSRPFTQTLQLTFAGERAY